METVADCDLRARYLQVRQFTETLTEPLTAEDCMVQSMDDASPTRWHLAHTTWFFETFVLKSCKDYIEFDAAFNFLFNSYYNTIGPLFPRGNRGAVSRPSLEQVFAYRQYVDAELSRRLEEEAFATSVERLLLTGIHHEQQHQELILTDIKHALACNPLWPIYRKDAFATTQGDTGSRIAEDNWVRIEEGVVPVGFAGDPNAVGEFCFDNELPPHPTYVAATELNRALVTCGEYLEFIDAGGYTRPEHWLSAGWQAVQDGEWQAPLYWTKEDGRWMQFTLAGLVPVNPAWPVTHVSMFEADAYARWRGMRLPTEFEWEAACCQQHSLAAASYDDANFADHLLSSCHCVHPARQPLGLLGGVWQWTSSSYAAYPGYRQPAGAVGEYNGKFMCNQYVLRGGSVATSSSHIRPTYRNFFPAHTRWQFSGIRLAR